MKKKAKKESYRAKIKVLGRTYESEGATIADAISGLRIEGSAKGTAILTLSRGGSSKERVLPGAQVYRLFSPSRLMREVAIKSLSLMFGI